MKRKMHQVEVAALIAVASVCSSCATLLCGSRQKIMVEANVTDSVTIFADGKLYRNVRLPAKVKIRRREPQSKITVMANRHSPQTQTLDKRLNALVALNAATVPFAPLALVVDWATGANKVSPQESVSFTLQPSQSNAEVADAYNAMGMELYESGTLWNGQLERAFRCFELAYSADPSGVEAICNMELVNFKIARHVRRIEEQRSIDIGTEQRHQEIMQTVAAVASAAGNVAIAVQTAQGGGAGAGGAGGSTGRPECDRYQREYDQWKAKAGGTNASVASRQANIVHKNTTHHNASELDYKLGTDIASRHTPAKHGDYRVKTAERQLARQQEKNMNAVAQRARRAGCPLQY
jgi:hypothetical protein